MSSFLALLPFSIQKDETVKRLAETLDGEISAIDAAINKLIIYADIDNLTEPLLTELAESFHMTQNEGWRFANTAERKRALVKSALALHRHKGTLYAVKQALSLLGITGRIQEWFDYGGEPYRFKIDIELNGEISQDDILLLEALVNEFKNVRSHIDIMSFKLAMHGTLYYAAAGLMHENISVLPYRPVAVQSVGSIYFAATTRIEEFIKTGRI